MEIRNVIELSAFSKSLSKKITYLNHEERILIDIEQIAAITPTSEREDLPKKVGLASCNNDEAKEELYTCVLLKCGFSVLIPAVLVMFLLEDNLLLLYFVKKI